MELRREWNHLESMARTKKNGQFPAEKSSSEALARTSSSSVPSFQARASFSGQCLALSHLDSSFAEPGRHYQMVWFPLFWRGSICFKNHRNELHDKHGSSMSCWARINIARIKIGGCCCNRTCAPQSSKRCKQSSCPRSAACWKRSNSWWLRDYGQHLQLKTLANQTDYK